MDTQSRDPFKAQMDKDLRNVPFGTYPEEHVIEQLTQTAIAASIDSNSSYAVASVLDVHYKPFKQYAAYIRGNNLYLVIPSTLVRQVRSTSGIVYSITNEKGVVTYRRGASTKTGGAMNKVAEDIGIIANIITEDIKDRNGICDPNDTISEVLRRRPRSNSGLDGYDGRYENAPEDESDTSYISFTTVLGEDPKDGEPFCIEVDYRFGEWQPHEGTRGHKATLWVLRNGQIVDEYKDPGKDLVNVPEPIRGQALAWIENQLEDKVHRYQLEDPRDNYGEDY